MDMLRGIGMVLIAAAAFAHVLAVWMVFAAGILLSVCGAVFRPGVNSSIPTLVPPSRLSNAVAAGSAASTGSNMLGNVAGGFLYQLFGAPLLFLFNGLSYFFSGVSLWFVRLASGRTSPDGSEKAPDFWKDMRDGFRYMWNQKGLRVLLLIAAVTNFFSFVAIVLFLPLFERTPSLGAGLYGVAMACFMGGAMAGFLVFSAVTIPPRRKAAVFILAGGLSNLSFVLALNQPYFAVMIPFVLLGGFFNAVLNVLLQAAVQAATPDDKRGKVLAFMNMTTQSLTPFAMALGGILAAFFPMRLIISVSFLINVLVISPFAFFKPFVGFLNDDPAESMTVAE